MFRRSRIQNKIKSLVKKMIIEDISEGDFEEINELLERNGLTSIDYKFALYNKYPSSKYKFSYWLEIKRSER